MLSALAHGKDHAGEAIGRAILSALGRLDVERGRLYFDLVLSAMNQAAKAALEALMANGTYEYQSDFARRYVAEGRAEGEAKGKADAVLAVFAARGIAVSDEQRTKVLACTDLAVLGAWLARAVVAASAADVLAD